MWTLAPVCVVTRFAKHLVSAEMSLVDAKTTLAYYAVELRGIAGIGAYSLGCTDVWARG